MTSYFFWSGLYFLTHSENKTKRSGVFIASVSPSVFYNLFLFFLLLSCAILQRGEDMRGDVSSFIKVLSNNNNQICNELLKDRDHNHLP